MSKVEVNAESCKSWRIAISIDNLCFALLLFFVYLFLFLFVFFLFCFLLACLFISTLDIKFQIEDVLSIQICVWEHTGKNLRST